MSGVELDPVTVEIIQNALVSFIREMRGAIIRTAFGPIIWETHDFSCGLLAPDGELVALSEDNPVHIVPTMYSVPAVRERFADAIAPGDVFVLNDPYRLGTHANDVAHLYPFFVEDRLVFWIVVRVHYPDVGGMAAGSITPDAREIYQEGLFLPPIKVYEGGRLNEAFMDLFLANVRVPEERRGDFMAVMGAFWTADKRLREILGSFGLERITQAHQVTRNRAQRRMQEAITGLPEGAYSYELNLDSNGVSPGWVPLRVTLVVGHRPEPALTLDFGDSAPVTPGPMNGAPATAACAAFTAVKAVLDPHSQTNGGSFRPLRIVTRPGTIFEARRPAAMCGSLDLGYRVMELVMGVLGSIRPEDAVGDHSSPSHLYLPGWDPIRERQYVFYELPIGGTGAVADHDGSDAVAGFERGDFARISSMEIWEHQVPFFAVENALLPDSGGPGRFRGGLGMRRSWRLLAETSSVSDLSEPCLVPGYGVLGGYGGAPSTCRVRRGTEVIWPGGVARTGKATKFPLRQGDVVEFDKWGGGGYGDPLERDPERVLADLEEGFISSESAFAVYGVVIRDGAVDASQTVARRRDLLAERVFVLVDAGEQDTVDGGTRLWEIGPALAERLRVADREVLECIHSGRAPLRGLARIRPGLPPDRLAIGPVGRTALGAQRGDEVWLRKVPGVLYPEG
ncbi:MAG: hydantoinase B/oxoprolinase family protein [Proteobacteria bacterium]|nr:hydantoinase B/oxoprolinase family protein [Pseudomonadota bacterium]